MNSPTLAYRSFASKRVILSCKFKLPFKVFCLRVPGAHSKLKTLLVLSLLLLPLPVLQLLVVQLIIEFTVDENYFNCTWAFFIRHAHFL